MALCASYGKFLLAPIFSSFIKRKKERKEEKLPRKKVEGQWKQKK